MGESEQSGSPLSWEMEKVEAQRDRPLIEVATKPGEWTYGNFIENLLDETPVPYESLPGSVHLDNGWHNVFNDLVAKTIREDVEWIYSIEKAKGFGEKHPSLFRFGPKRGDKIGTTPPSHSFWDPFTFSLRFGLSTRPKAAYPETIGTVHTHTTQEPLWAGDLAPLLLDQELRVVMVAVKSGNFLALKSKDTPYYDISDWDITQIIEFKERFFEPYKTISKSREPKAHPAEIQEISQKPGGDLRITESACKIYKIGLYLGGPNESLERII